MFKIDKFIHFVKVSEKKNISKRGPKFENFSKNT